MHSSLNPIRGIAQTVLSRRTETAFGVRRAVCADTPCKIA